MFAEYQQATNLLKAANTVSSDGYRKFCIDHEATVHPARMPKSLVEFFVRFLTEEGDTVLDPFAGSNTTGAVAENLCRRWLAVEAEWTYAAHSLGRFDPTSVKAVGAGITADKRKSDSTYASSALLS
jgi:site-specific DNA-methyltransferase (cytosine-N4-specific)